MSDDIFDRLMAELHHRVAELPEGSYATKLLQGGIPKMGSKIIEEANEVIEAAGEPGDAGVEHAMCCFTCGYYWPVVESMSIHCAASLNDAKGFRGWKKNVDVVRGAHRERSRKSSSNRYSQQRSFE
jgi:phosphoribosyl-ATP pyrophosphohydrolase